MLIVKSTWCRSSLAWSLRRLMSVTTVSMTCSLSETMARTSFVAAWTMRFVVSSGGKSSSGTPSTSTENLCHVSAAALMDVGAGVKVVGEMVTSRTRPSTIIAGSSHGPRQFVCFWTSSGSHWTPISPGSAPPPK